MTPQDDKRSAIDLVRLTAYIRKVLPDAPTSIEITGFAQGGSSNITAFLAAGDEEWVLRRPPLGNLLPSAHDMIREYRFIHALQASGVPVAPTVLPCEDPSVLGAPFYLARRVQGAVLQDSVPDGFRDPAEAKALAYAAIDALAAIHEVPWEGLDVPYRPGDYLERQVRRWSGQIERTTTASRLTGLLEVTAWIRDNMPRHAAQTIVHGDFGLHNMIVQPPPGARINAVLDWEMATIGDPLADLAWFVSGWGRSQEDGGVRNPANVIATWTGAPSSDDLLARYEATTGRAMTSWRFYEAFTMWKGAVVTEGLYNDYVSGTAANPTVVRFETEVPKQVARLCELLEIRP